MIQVSNEFRQVMESRRDFKCKARVTLGDGRELQLDGRHFTLSGNSFTDGAGANAFPLGNALEKSVSLELMNDEDQYSSYDFFGAKIELSLTFELSESTETIPLGTYTVVTPETYGTVIGITAVDDMYRADRDYATNLTFPQTAGAVLRDICSACDIPLGASSFPHDDFVIETKPEGQTFRQVIGQIAMLAGGNARIDHRGYLQILVYDFSPFEQGEKRLAGGVFDQGEPQYATGDAAYGGAFAPWEAEESHSGGTFADWKHYHVLAAFQNLTVDTDDIVITGVQATVKGEDGEEDSVLLKGEEGYVLSMENPLIEGKEEEVLSWLATCLVGLRFRKFSGDLTADPTIEFMDLAYVVDRKGNSYQTVVTDMNFVFFGYTTVSNSAESAVRNSSSYYSQATQSFLEARKLVEKEKSDRELAMEKLSEALANSSGLYITSEEQEDGSRVYYMHDKPSLSESQFVWKLTAEAFGISTDGGKTYPYGFTVTGEMVTRILDTEGLNAGWIDTGALSVRDEEGHEIFYADVDTGLVRIDASSVYLGAGNLEEELDGMREQNAQLSVKVDEISGKVSQGGGVNLLKNSVGYFGLDHWEAENDVSAERGDRVIGTTVSQAGFLLDGGKLTQENIPIVSGERYTLSFLVSKPGNFTGRVTVLGSNEEIVLDIPRGEKLMQMSYTFTAISSVSVTLLGAAGSELLISDLRLVKGEDPLTWQLAAGEVFETNYQMSSAGLIVSNSEYDGQVGITPQGLTGTYNGEKVFYLNREYVTSQNLRVTQQIELSPFKMVPVTKNGKRGMGLVPLPETEDRRTWQLRAAPSKM